MIDSPNRFAFSGDKPGVIINEGDLSAANLNLIGGTVVNVGSLNASGNITAAAVPGGNTVRISQRGAILGLEVTATELQQGINPLDIPALLTTPVEGVTKVNHGDTVVAGSVVADTVNLSAVNRIKLGLNGEIITGNGQFSAPTVTIFPDSEIAPLAYIFLDVTVPDYETFLYSGKPGTTTVVVTPEESGIGVISDRLAVVSETGQQVDEVHIVSEGNQGNFWLGQDFVSSDNIEQYQAQFASWDKALGVGADILIYACLAALGETGQTLLNKVATYTGADVAGSTNLTGAESLGGDWLLERSVGNVEATTPWLLEAVGNYNDTLQIFTIANNNDNGTGSLREAITSANGNKEADEIRFDPGFFDGSQGVILLTSGELEITAAEDLEIDGAFGGAANVVVDGNNASRVFNITGSGNVTFESLTIQNGNSADEGGGIQHIGISTLTVNNSKISDNISQKRGGGIAVNGGGDLAITDNEISNNQANISGGGIFNNGNVAINNTAISGNQVDAHGAGILNYGGTITIDNSTISGNQADSRGGGINNNNGGIITIDNSAISNNDSGKRGGAIHNNTNGIMSINNSSISGNVAGIEGGGGISNGIGNVNGSINIENTTISGNKTTGNGGSILSDEGKVTISSSTISDNEATGSGGGISNESGATANIFNTIIAGNQGTNPDVFGDFNDDGNNLIGVVDGSTGFTTSSLVGTSANPIDPQLASLGNYGGTTQTHALLPGSPAINAGSNNNAPTADQRGVTRGTVDIGAFEVSTDLAVSKTVDNPNPVAGDTVTFTITLNNNGTDPVGRLSLSDILPSGLTLVSANASSGSYDTNTGTWNVGSIDGSSNLLTDGTNAVLNITATANQDISGTLTNTANNLSFVGEDTSTSNNEASINLNVIPALGNDIMPPDEEIIIIEDETTDLNFSLFNQENSILKINSLEIEIIEESISSTFTSYLETPAISPLNLQEVQNTLATIEAKTDIKPALIYATFAPTSADTPVNQDSSLKQQASKTKQSGQLLWQSTQQGFNTAQETNLFNQQGSQDNYQLELILVAATGETIRNPVEGATKAEVIKQMKTFRRAVSNPSRNAHLKLGQQFYQWLVVPLEAELQQRGIDNLVFILDEGLRSIPLAAMMDGDQFIIEKYSVGLMPSLSLTDTSHVDIQNSQVLAMGAETFTEQNPLPAVPGELSLVTKQLWSGQSYLNQDFTLANLKQARNLKPYGIIHLATHGEFNPGKLSNSYIQLWDEKLPLDSLRTLGWNNPPVELLILSACRTALGNREAELGFAGLAVQAGVKSALGSLWTVSDEGTLGLMSNFYQQLKTAPIKAEALRQAQLSMLRGEVYLEDGQLISGEYKTPLPEVLADIGNQDLSHPYYWSGFTMIGNPW